VVAAVASVGEWYPAAHRECAVDAAVAVLPAAAQSDRWRLVAHDASSPLSISALSRAPASAVSVGSSL
jgi:hypothetical protein